MDRFQYHLVGMCLWWPSTKIVQAVMICQKTWPLGVRGIFSLYIYIENFKYLLLRNCSIKFNVTWQECCFGDLLPRLFTPSWYIKKHGCQGRGLFFEYICIENFKILHVRNHLSDFIITWQECCFGDPLPRLFMQSWFIKKHGCKGCGLFSLYI